MCQTQSVPASTSGTVGTVTLPTRFDSIDDEETPLTIGMIQRRFVNSLLPSISHLPFSLHSFTDSFYFITRCFLKFISLRLQENRLSFMFST